jgi:hypothetical protein
MKTRYILFASFAFAVAVFAMPRLWPSYDETKQPSLSLPAAYDKATAALGPATNRFHCVSASLDNFFFRDGEWHFLFITSSPTNGAAYSWPVMVYFDGTVVTNPPAL